MDTAVGRNRFWELFKGRAVVVSELPAGHSRVLANTASGSGAVRNDATRTPSASRWTAS